MLGVDGCKQGWVGAVAGPAGLRVVFGRTIGELVGTASEQAALSVIAIDIPIGLPDESVRECDLVAKQALGKRAASVFITATRAALTAANQAEATAVNRALTGQGVSAQAFGLAAKINEVDRWLPSASACVVEVHPELSFTALAGAPLLASKKSWNGQQQRMALLAREGLLPGSALDDAVNAVATDDILDACAAAWSALRIARGQAYSLPDKPEVFSDGISAAIWV